MKEEGRHSFDDRRRWDRVGTLKMHSRALGDGLVLRYFYDGCDNSVLRGFLPTHTQVQVIAYVDYKNAKQPVTGFN